MDKIAFIGMGNMGKALLKGALKTMDSSSFMFSDKFPSEEIMKEFGVEGTTDNTKCAKDAKYIFLAVKPQYFGEVEAEIRKYVTSDKVIVSIMAGITIDRLKKAFDGARIVRVMPNTPALVEAGMSGVCFDNSEYTEEEKQTVLGILESCGKVEIITSEALMSAVTCVSGSSPAYVYVFIEALADSAVKYGLPRKAAYEMAAQTVLGAAKMVLETGMVPAELKDMVCSPGGTTIAGIAALEEFGFRNAVIKATDKCYEKAEALK